jgi:NADPH-dependent F420 reductase
MQSIAIIGSAGNMGSAIATQTAKGNYRLLLFDNSLQDVKALRERLLTSYPTADIEAMDCSHTAAWEADIIILAVPYGAEKEIADKIREVAQGKIVISIANPLNDSFDGLVTTPDTSAAEELQKLLPHSKIIKAFNTTFAADFGQPVIDGKKVDSFLAGDDENALESVSDLVTTIGFNPIVAGRLKVSRTLEQMQLLLIQLGLRYNYNWLAGWKILHQ